MYFIIVLQKNVLFFAIIICNWLILNKILVLLSLIIRILEYLYTPQICV